MPKKQKKNKKFEIESASLHPSQPKVPKKKKNKRMYFDMDVQDAIVRYNALDPDENQAERNIIYQEEIHYAFDKLCENIINTFKFEYFDDVYIDVKHAVVAFLVMNIHKYDHTKGSKAFSYFSVVAKNYLILHNNNNYKKYKSHDDILVVENKIYNDNNASDYSDLTAEIIKYFEKNIAKIFKKKKDIDIAYSIIELFKTRDQIENFNKKSLYILIREMSNVSTANITTVVNVFKKHYNNILSDYYRYGYVRSKNGRFFR